MKPAHPAPEGALNYSKFNIPDGVVIGMPWPHTFVTWPGGRGRDATKVEHDLWQIAAKERARCERLEGALARVEVEVRQSKATLYIDGVKICALPTHLDGNPAESEKLIEWAGVARALDQPEDGK